LKKYIVLIFLLTTGFSYAQNTSRAYRIQVTGKNKAVSKLQADSAIKVINKRLLDANYISCSVLYNNKKKEFLIESTKIIDENFINDWLLKPCRVIFYECYTGAELQEGLFSVKSKKEIEETKKKFTALLNIGNQNTTGYNISYTGMVKISDTAAFNKTISALKPYIPADCIFVYNQKLSSSDEPFSELYALKDNVFKMVANPLLDSVKMNFDEMGYPVTRLYFNNRGKKAFAGITEKNINRAIAITVDGLVYSAPVVNSKIEGGIAQISGNYTAADAKQMAAMLSGGYLSLRLTLIK
jgi:hypothetical protein